MTARFHGDLFWAAWASNIVFDDGLKSLDRCEPGCPNPSLRMCPECQRLNHEAHMDLLEESDFRFHWSFCGDELCRITRLELPADLPFAEEA